MCLPIKVFAPDRILAEGTHKGFEWAIAHNNGGYRCGYIKITPNHPWHEKHYDDINASCHGGLTYAEPDTPCEGEGRDDSWWLGFDCAHYNDAPDSELPGASRGWGIDAMLFGNGDLGDSGGTVWTQEMVQAECEGLCQQASEAWYENRIDK